MLTLISKSAKVLIQWALAGVILFYLAFDKQKEALQEQRRATGLQSEELKLQRKELIETREEFHGYFGLTVPVISE